MNQEQLIILIDKLESVAMKLSGSIKADTIIDTKLLAHDANKELLEVIEVLLNQAKEMES